MSLTDINIGTIPNDGTGDTLRDGGQVINDNFDLVGAHVDDTTIHFLQSAIE